MDDLSYNTDEASVPDYVLPDALWFADGRPVVDARTWIEQRRPELISLFEEHVYGRTTRLTVARAFEVTSSAPANLSLPAIRKEVLLRFSAGANQREVHVLLFLPLETAGPMPAFVGLNFHGNQTIHPDPGITVSAGVTDDMSLSARGAMAGRWPLEKILSRDYALVTICKDEFARDDPARFRQGVHTLFDEAARGQPHDSEWGAIGAWAWGLSQALDYLAVDPAVDHQRVAVIGHSRLGKAALWAGAQDQRFAMVISNNSGCGGAALSRRRFGETVEAINRRFPHWFCRNFRRYDENEERLPVDQHLLLALIAPRPLYVASAADDLWADPAGEFLSLQGAASVYNLLGESGFPLDQMPAVDEPVLGRVAYHVRSGAHDITDFDWSCYLDFADRHLR